MLLSGESRLERSFWPCHRCGFAVAVLTISQSVPVHTSQIENDFVYILSFVPASSRGSSSSTHSQSHGGQRVGFVSLTV